MKVNLKKNQMKLNLLMNVAAFVVQFIINFYISPMIVGKVGASAYGFLGLANDFVSYASIIATVFNSVASRFIAEAYYKKDYDKANAFFNSLIITNIIMSAVLGIVGIGVVYNLDKMLTISTNLIVDVKITFALVFLSYIITLITMVFTTATFVSNRTDIQGIRNIINNLVRFALIIVFLNFISVKLYWVALSSLVATTIIAIMNISLTKKLTPELIIKSTLARIDYVIVLAKSGVWMTFNSISNILLRGLDLTIANIWLGDYEMGLLSISRTIPNNVTSVIATLAPVFTPVFVSHYAKGEKKSLNEYIKKSINTMALILFAPITSFIVYSVDFYQLWQKSLNMEEIYLVAGLSCLTVIQAYFNSVTATMAQISVVTDKLKLPTVITFLCGIISFGLEIFLLKFTNLGLFAIVISTTIVLILRYVFVNSMYAAYCLELPKSYFFKTVIKTWLIIPLLFLESILIRKFIVGSSWIMLLFGVTVTALVGYAISVLVLFPEKVRIILKKGKI